MKSIHIDHSNTNCYNEQELLERHNSHLIREYRLKLNEEWADRKFMNEKLQLKQHEQREFEKKQLQKKERKKEKIDERKKEIAKWDAGHELTKQILRAMRQTGTIESSNKSNPSEDKINNVLLKKLKDVDNFKNKSKKATLVPRTNTISENDTNKKHGYSYFTINMQTLSQVDIIEGHKIGILGCLELAVALGKCTSSRVKVIDLGWNKIENRGFIALLDVFGNGIGVHLTTLDVRNNHITSHGLKKFREAMNERSALVSLRHLDLRHNPIKCDGARIMVHILLSGKLNEIESIVMKNCDIRDGGIQAIYSVCSSSSLRAYAPNLKVVNVRNNRQSASLMRKHNPWPKNIQI